MAQGSFDDFAVPAVPEPDGTRTAGAIDLDATVREYVGHAVLKYRLGETYWYSVAPTVIAGTGGSPTPAYVVTMYARSPMIGAVLVEGAIQTGFPTGEEFDRIVSSLIESLRAQALAALR